MDQLLTFIGDKKKRIYIITLVDPANLLLSRLKYGLGTHPAGYSRYGGDAPRGKIYNSDAFDAYDRLWYHFGRYEVS